MASKYKTFIQADFEKLTSKYLSKSGLFEEKSYHKIAVEIADKRYGARNSI